MKRNLLSSPAFYLAVGLAASAAACLAIDLVLAYDPPFPVFAQRAEPAAPAAPVAHASAGAAAVQSMVHDMGDSLAGFAVAH